MLSLLKRSLGKLKWCYIFLKQRNNLLFLCFVRKKQRKNRDILCFKMCLKGFLLVNLLKNIFYCCKSAWSLNIHQRTLYSKDMMSFYGGEILVRISIYKK